MNELYAMLMTLKEFKEQMRSTWVHSLVNAKGVDYREAVKRGQDYAAGYEKAITLVQKTLDHLEAQIEKEAMKE